MLHRFAVEGAGGDGGVTPPIFLACTEDDTVKVNKFLKKKVDPNAVEHNHGGFSPLGVAAQLNHAWTSC